VCERERESAGRMCGVHVGACGGGSDLQRESCEEEAVYAQVWWW
jgi:hypothetical protein